MQQPDPLEDSSLRTPGFTPAVALTIAGSDCSAGAGVQADLKTFAALRVYGLTALTCVVAEVPGKVSALQTLPAEIVRSQIELVLTKFPVAAIKTGLLCSAEIVELVADLISRLAANIPLLVDPVMIATSGDVLLEPSAMESYRTRLFLLATLVTPNLPEASVLVGRPVRNLLEMRRAGRELAHQFKTRFLLKGGHLTEGNAIDLLCEDDAATEFPGEFIRHVATHGTGCTYSAAITAGLARGLSLQNSIARAKEFMTNAIANHFSFSDSSGEIHALNHRLP